MLYLCYLFVLQVDDDGSEYLPILNKLSNYVRDKDAAKRRKKNNFSQE